MNQKTNLAAARVAPARPSVIERPTLRLRFTDPDGNVQQATLATSWYPHEESVQCRPQLIADRLSEVLGMLGCTVESIERVGHHVQDF